MLRKNFIFAFSFVVLVGILTTVVIASEEDRFVYDDENKRDPFWPLVSPSGTIVSYDTDLLITDMILEGIIADPGGKNIAIINGIIVKVGSTIGLFEIENINKNSVILTKGDERYVLNLKTEE